MAILDKISGFAKSVGGMAGNAAETNKLNSKISAEQSAVNEVMKQIGEFYYKKYAETGKADNDITEFCAKIDGHNAAIAEAKAEIQRINAAAAAASGGLVCSACGKPSAPDKKFCAECGGKIIAVAPVAADGMVCSACGKPGAKDKKFCGECGGKLKAAAPAAKDGAVCPACGKTNTVDKKFCSDCGGKLEAEKKSNAPAAAAKNKSKGGQKK